MKDQTEYIMFICGALAMRVVLMPSWPAALAFMGSCILVGVFEFVKRERIKEREETLARIKHIEDRMTGLTLTRGMGR